jgi:hypothetical protein
VDRNNDPMHEIASRSESQLGEDVMITLAQCTSFAALAPNEIVLGPTPCAKHHLLLTSYLLNMKRGPEVVRDMMVSDLRRWLDLGAVQGAADLLIVLRLFLFDYPEARFIRHSDGQKDLLSPRHFGINWGGRTPMASPRQFRAGAPSRWCRPAGEKADWGRA